MRKVDVLLAGVLAVAVLATAFGVATYEDTRRTVFSVTWSTRTVDLAAQTAAVTGAGEAAFDVPLDLPNLTRVELVATVAGSAARVQPTAVRVEIVAPDGNVSTGEGALAAGGPGSVDVRVEVAVAPVPASREVAADSPAAARAAADAEGHERGRGTWRVVVRIAPGALGAAESYTVALRGVAAHSTADVAPAAPEVRGR